MPDVPSEITELIEALATLDSRATAIIRRAPGLQARFNATDPWATALREAADRAAAERVRIVGAIWDAEELSLAKLATRIGKSKSRTDDLVRASKRQREMTED